MPNIYQWQRMTFCTSWTQAKKKSYLPMPVIKRGRFILLFICSSHFKGLFLCYVIPLFPPPPLATVGSYYVENILNRDFSFM